MCSFNIFDIFQKEIQPPYTYNVTFHDIKSAEEIFEKILEIYKIGCIVRFGDLDKKYIEISKLTPNNRLLMKQYMMSFGIDAKITYYTSQDIDSIYSQFIKDIKKIDNRFIVKYKKNNLNLIDTLVLQLPNNLEVLENLNNLIKNRQEYLDLLDIYVSKNKLENFKCKVKDANQDVYVLRFYYL